MILFAASDNDAIDLDDYPEVRNRAFITSTDTSAGLTEKVKQRQADIEVGRYDQKISDKRQTEIRQYIGSIPSKLYTEDERPGEVWNLTHGGFANVNPLPDLFPESRMDFKRFNNFVKAVTLFHYGSRMEVSSPDRDAAVSLVSTPEDLWLAWKIFGEKMVLSALNLTDKDFVVLDLLREAAQAKTVADVQNEIRKEGQNMSDTQIRNSLDKMQDKGYVIKDASQGRVRYQPAPFATADTVSKDISVDFQEIVDQTIEDARYAMPDDMGEEYVEQFCKGEGLITTHPTKGEQVNIIQADLGSVVSERKKQQEDTIDETNPFDTEDDEGDTNASPDNAAEQLSGTIGD